jgi:hypothetical protein
VYSAHEVVLACAVRLCVDGVRVQCASSKPCSRALSCDDSGVVRTCVNACGATERGSMREREREQYAALRAACRLCPHTKYAGGGGSDTPGRGQCNAKPHPPTGRDLF